MLILAIETSTLTSSVALLKNGSLAAELSIHTKKTHSEMLMPNIEQMLVLAGADRKDLSAVAVSIGPGSFTGLRIGLSTAKALAYALNIPIVGVPTLTALAYNCPIPGALLSPMLDAQKGNVYQALYKWQNGQMHEVIPARVIGFDAALDELNSQDLPTILLGEIAVANGDKIRSFTPKIAQAEAHIIMPRAGSVAALGQRMLLEGTSHNVMTLDPFYIRRSEAEELWERRQGACI